MLTPELCSAMLSLHEAMAEAARANDWDRLTQLEAETAQWRIAAQATPASDSMTSPSAQQQMARDLKRMLALEAEIRIHVDPFIASTRKLLARDVERRQSIAVRAAYSSLSP